MNKAYTPTQRAVLAHLYEHGASVLMSGSRVLQRVQTMCFGDGLQMNVVTPFFLKSYGLIEQAGDNYPRYVFRLTDVGRSEAERIGATNPEAEFKQYRRGLKHPNGTHRMRY